MPSSSNPAKRSRQLANLKRGGQPAPAGNQRAVTHGAYAAIARVRLDAKVLEVFNALSGDVPLQSPADGAAIQIAAECLCRADNVADYLARRGIEDDQGELRVGAIDLERRLRAEAADHLDSLGLTPRSRVRLGLDVARAQAFDLAQHWADHDTDDRDAVADA